MRVQDKAPLSYTEPHAVVADDVVVEAAVASERATVRQQLVIRHAADASKVALCVAFELQILFFGISITVNCSQ